MGQRRRSRELALKVLYQMEQGGDSPTKALKIFAENFDMPANTFDYAAWLVRSVYENQEDIDQILNRASRKWRVERMAMIDRSIMRLACFEICFAKNEDVPRKVAINEAIELSKIYSADDSPKFINAVLDSLPTDMPASEPAAADED